MARGRMLNASIAKDKQLNALSIEAEYIYLKAIPHLDRDGLINGDPTLLWSDICPRRKELMPKMQSLIDEIVASGLVISYYCDKVEDTVLYFVGFRKNNMAMRYEREAPSRFSLPPGYRHTPTGLSNTDSDDDEHDPCDAGSDQDDDGQSPDKVPTKSRPNPREDQDQDQDQGKHSAQAPTPDKAAPTKVAVSVSPPPSVGTGDPYLDAARDKFKRGNMIAAWQAELNLKLSPDKRVPIVNAIGKACGLTARMNGDDKTLESVHREACWFFESGYDTPEKIEELHKVYLSDDWRRKNHPRPSLEAFTKFASAQLDELPKVPESPKANKTNGKQAEYVSPLRRMKIYDGREVAA